MILIIREMDDKYIDEHVRIISPYEMTVFITDPIRIEAYLHPMGNYRRQDTECAKLVDGKYVLNSHGYYWASRALRGISRKAKLFWLHRLEFKDFLTDFHTAYEQLEKKIAEIRSITNEYRDNADWIKVAESFKNQRRLMEQLSSLYREMFVTRFGKDDGILYEEEIDTLLKELEGNHVEE